MKTYPLSTALARIEQKYGRSASLGKLKQKVYPVLGIKPEYTGREIVRMTRPISKGGLINPERIPVSPEQKARIRELILANREKPSYERLTLTEIAKQANKRFPVNVSNVSGINTALRKELASKGKDSSLKVGTRAKYILGIVDNIKTVIRENPSITLEKAAAKLKITPRELQEALKLYETSFRHETTLQLHARIQAIDIMTGHELSNAELASQVGLSMKGVAEIRQKYFTKGRSRATKSRARKISRQVLIWARFFSEKNGVAQFNELTAKIPETTLIVAASLSMLRKQGLIERAVVRNKSKKNYVYKITPKGTNELTSTQNGLGHLPKNILLLKTEELRALADQLEGVAFTTGRTETVLPTINQIKTELKQREINKFKGN
ncbi:MAG: winged helix-turn-helix transcriptional regulator [archaeon]|jgi:Mn-dependent DtxR family transcriptional regulator